MINFRTDLATERREIYRKANKIENEIPGVETRRIWRWKKHKNNEGKYC